MQSDSRCSRGEERDGTMNTIEGGGIRELISRRQMSFTFKRTKHT
jgi:hypothetical protein